MVPNYWARQKPFSRWVLCILSLFSDPTSLNSIYKFPEEKNILNFTIYVWWDLVCPFFRIRFKHFGRNFQFWMRTIDDNSWKSCDQVTQNRSFKKLCQFLQFGCLQDEVDEPWFHHITQQPSPSQINKKYVFLFCVIIVCAFSLIMKNYQN